MRIVFDKNSFDPYINLSLEEVLLKDSSFNEDILLLYINHNAIIFGRNQNVHEEINSDYVEQNNIKLVRRVSGGGAVYHDDGNVNFSFITKKGGNYSSFLKPIIEFLKTLGINAEFKGKNDVVVDGAKISGNAQYIYKERMFHHGTLLFNADLTVLGSALKPNKLKLESKGIKSARQRVSNILDLLPDKITQEEFIEKLIQFFIENNNAEVMDISEYKKNEIKALSNVRKSNNWVFGKNPKFNLSTEKRFPGGTISIKLLVEQNKISEMSITGDFLSTNDFENIYPIFIGQDFSDNNIKNIIDSMNDFGEYFGKITKEEITHMIVGTND